MKRSQEKGSAHLIIIIALIVLLAGALGVIFYQNFIAKKAAVSDTSNQAPSSSQSTTSSSSATTTTKLLQRRINSVFGVNLAFSYPETWTISDDTQGPSPLDASKGNTSETLKLTSPSGKYVVTYTVAANGGFGGTCDPTDAGTYASTAYEKLPAFSAMDYVELTYNGAPNNTVGFDGLMNATAAEKIAQGGSLCDGYLQTTYKLSDTNSVYLMNASFSVTGATNASDLQKALSGTEYDQAKAILLSTSYQP